MLVSGLTSRTVLAAPSTIRQRALTPLTSIHRFLLLPVLRRKDPEHVHHTDPGHDAKVWQSKVMLGPGAPDADNAADNAATIIPGPADTAVGKERLEYLARQRSEDPYFGLMNTLPSDRKGTKEKPIEVPSPDEDRLIGCSGVQGERHQTEWMLITENGHKYWEFGHNRCPECGNTFKLKKVELPYGSIY